MTALNTPRRPDQFYSYLLDYLRNNSGPWTTLRAEIRFLGQKALILSGQQEFAALAIELTDRFDKKLNADGRSRLAVLTAQEPNAFATAPSRCDGVLLTKGAFDRIQDLARESAYGIYALLSSDQTNFPLVRAWGGLPVDEPNLYAFAGLVAHLTEAVLVHHEIAHLVLGHEYAWRFSLEKNTDEADPNQCLELDADLHALTFTEEYLAERLQSVPLDSDPLNVAWHHFLGDAASRSEFVLFCAYLLLLAMASGDGRPVIAELRSGSHPHLVVRQLLALLAQQNWRGVSTRNAIDLVYFAAAVHGSTRRDAPSTSAEELTEALGIASLSANPDAFKTHIDGLGWQLTRYEGRLNTMKRLPSEERIRWFAS